MSPIQRLSAPSGAQRKPWLAKEWQERRIVKHDVVPVRGVFVALALAFFGFPAIIAVAVGIWAMVEGNPEGLVGLVGGAAFIGFVAYLTYMWLKWRKRKLGKSVCYLETLPGVIGGWFKASVEVELPVGTLPAVLVTLKNGVTDNDTNEWEISERVFPAEFTRIGGERYLVPVRFHIPARKDFYHSNLGPGLWVLNIRPELPGMNFGFGFIVPIIETDEAPPEEQTPEGELWIVEVVYYVSGWDMWRRKRKFGDLDAKLIAKAGRENTYSGICYRERERDLGWHFKTQAEAQECADKFRGDPTLQVRVYDEEHQ